MGHYYLGARYIEESSTSRALLVKRSGEIDLGGQLIAFTILLFLTPTSASEHTTLTSTLHPPPHPTVLEFSRVAAHESHDIIKP